jgi:hypothetical protein
VVAAPVVELVEALLLEVAPVVLAPVVPLAPLVVGVAISAGSPVSELQANASTPVKVRSPRTDVSSAVLMVPVSVLVTLHPSREESKEAVKLPKG